MSSDRYQQVSLQYPATKMTTASTTKRTTASTTKKTIASTTKKTFASTITKDDHSNNKINFKRNQLAFKTRSGSNQF